MFIVFVGNMFKKGILLFAILATCNYYQPTESFAISLSRRSSNLDKWVEQSRLLKYGDDCSWEAEEYRQNITKESLSRENKIMIMDVINTIVERDYKMCSAAELFICDKESQKCVCGDPDYEAIMGVNRSLYVLEGGNKCRWDTRTYCISTEHTVLTHKQMSYATGMKCISGSSCKIGGDGGACTKRGIMFHLLKTHTSAILREPGWIMKEMMAGRICTCQADPVGEVGGDVNEMNSGNRLNFTFGNESDVDVHTDAAQRTPIGDFKSEVANIFVKLGKKISSFWVKVANHGKCETGGLFPLRISAC